jgi:hypothetical protein
MNSKIFTYQTHAFLIAYYEKRFGNPIPFVEANDIIAAEILQLHIEESQEIQLCLSTRLAALKPQVFRPLFTRLFTAQLVSYVDAQIALGITVQDAIDNYIAYTGIDQNIWDMCRKLYERYRTPNNKIRNTAKKGRIAKRAAKAGLGFFS